MTGKRLIRIGVFSAMQHGLIVAFMLAYPVVVLLRFLQSFDPQRQAHPDTMPWWVCWLLMPVVFAVFGAIVAVLSSFAYNLSAKVLGGVRYSDQA